MSTKGVDPKYSQRGSQWLDLMRKFSEAHKEQCKSVSLEIPRVQRSTKTLPSGSQYDGTWDILGMSGYGTYLFPHGVVYEGEFSDGMFHGKGELRYPNGTLLRGRWKKGVMIDKLLIFPDGLEYAEVDWKYCRMPDRRFSKEIREGLEPAGNSYLTAELPTRDIPPGYYDTGDGFFDPKTRVVYKANDLTYIIRSPSVQEQKWIVDNCRYNPEVPLGARPDLYEKWQEPLPFPEPLPMLHTMNKRATFEAKYSITSDNDSEYYNVTLETDDVSSDDDDIVHGIF